MEEKKKTASKSNWFWIYAVLLFTSAFIILAITAYSQIKYNGEKGNIQTTLQKEVAAKDTYKINLNDALAENEAIINELEQYKIDNKAISDENALLKTENQKLQSNNLMISKTYDRYVTADSYYINGDWINSAKILYRNFDVTLLGATASARVAAIMKAIGTTVAQNAYLTGYNSYLAGKYADAADLFDLSIIIDNTTYYADDCFYLEAHCYMTLGNNEKALELLKILIDTYPESNLINEAKADQVKLQLAVSEKS
jgi:tetratricopeptide (TPR) repeat protein